MNITYLLTQDLHSPSGLGRYGPIAYQMAGSGHNVTVFALHPDIRSLKERTSSSNGLTVSYVAAMHVQKSGSEKTYYSPAELVRVASNATWALTRAGLSIQADIIHICKPHPMNSVAGLVAKYARGTHLVLDCDDYEAGSGHFESPWQRRLVAYFERTLPRKVKHVTTNTSFMRENILSWGVPQERITYLPNGVDRERFRHSDRNHTNQIRDQYDLIDREVISYIGSMSLASHAVDLLPESHKSGAFSNSDCLLCHTPGGAAPAAGAAAQPAPEAGESGDVSFTEDVLPSLEANCATCHGPMAMGGLGMTDYVTLMAGGQSGPVVVPGSPDDSPIVARMGEAHPAVLTGDDLQILIDWIAAGAEDN